MTLRVQLGRLGTTQGDFESKVMQKHKDATYNGRPMKNAGPFPSHRVVRGQFAFDDE